MAAAPSRLDKGRAFLPPTSTFDVSTPTSLLPYELRTRQSGYRPTAGNKIPPQHAKISQWYVQRDLRRSPEEQGRVRISAAPALITSIHLSEWRKISSRRMKLSSPAKLPNIIGNGATPKRESVAIVIPVFNEAANLPALWVRLRPILNDSTREWEVVFVDDG